MGPSIRPIRRLEVLGYQKVEEDELLGCLLVPGEGFEPPTFGLQNRCTTTVLTRPTIGIIVWKSLRIKVFAFGLTMYAAASIHRPRSLLHWRH